MVLSKLIILKHLNGSPYNASPIRSEVFCFTLGTLKQVGRQRDDDGQNHLVKISYCKESLSFTIHRMKSIQLREDNAWLYDSNEFYTEQISIL